MPRRENERLLAEGLNELEYPTRRRAELAMRYDPVASLMAQEGAAAVRARRRLGLTRAGDEGAVGSIAASLAGQQRPDGSFEGSVAKTAGVLGLLADLATPDGEGVQARAAEYLLAVLEAQPGSARAEGVRPGGLTAPCDLCGFFGPYEARNRPEVLAWGAREMNFYREFEPLFAPKAPVRAERRSSRDRPGPGSCFAWGLIPLAHCIEALSRAGHGEDRRLQAAIHALLGAQRASGGWCRNLGGHPACTLHALRALGAHPTLRRSCQAGRAVEFMRARGKPSFALTQAAAAFDFPVARQIVRDGLALAARCQRRNGSFGGACAVERVAAVLAAVRSQATSARAGAGAAER